MNLKLSIPLFLLVFLMIACKEQDSDLTYSCNASIDAYVKCNEKALAKLSRNDLLNYTKDTMRAIYRSFTPEKKMAIWQDRFASSLQSNYWSEEQKEIIRNFERLLSFKTFSNQNYFKREVEPAFKKILNSELERKTFSKMELYFLVASIEHESFLEALRYRENHSPSPGGGGTKCDCTTEGTNFWCEGFQDEECLSDDDCRKNSGCGLLFSHQCNGCCSVGGQAACGTY